MVNILNFSILCGWIVLALGAYLSRVFGRFRAVALGIMFAVALGILKGTNMTTIISLTGLSIALIPLGLQVVRSGDKPKLKTVFLYIILILLVLGSWLFMSNMESPN
ncbi:MAG TPA: hypothetical protein VKZ77_00835 [Bacillaceae bacterium]|nr:hypothetical protein [Bacillaceae bacterium]